MHEETYLGIYCMRALQAAARAGRRAMVVAAGNPPSARVIRGREGSRRRRSGIPEGGLARCLEMARCSYLQSRKLRSKYSQAYRMDVRQPKVSC